MKRALQLIWVTGWSVILAVCFLFTLYLEIARAQTVTIGEAKVSVVFYVKEGTSSPYQGLIQLTPEEYAAIKPTDMRVKQLDQFNAWKATTAAAKAAPVVEPTIDEKADQVKALRAQADEIAADPAVAAKLEVKKGGK